MTLQEYHNLYLCVINNMPTSAWFQKAGNLFWWSVFHTVSSFLQSRPLFQFTRTLQVVAASHQFKGRGFLPFRQMVLNWGCILSKFLIVRRWEEALQGKDVFFLAGWICFHLKPSYSKAIYYCLLVLSIVWGNRETQPKIQHQFLSGGTDAYSKALRLTIESHKYWLSCISFGFGLKLDLSSHKVIRSPNQILIAMEFWSLHL